MRVGRQLSTFDPVQLLPGLQAVQPTVAEALLPSHESTPPRGTTFETLFPARTGCWRCKTHTSQNRSFSRRARQLTTCVERPTRQVHNAETARPTFIRTCRYECITRPRQLSRVSSFNGYVGRPPSPRPRRSCVNSQVSTVGLPKFRTDHSRNTNNGTVGERIQRPRSELSGKTMYRRIRHRQMPQQATIWIGRSR